MRKPPSTDDLRALMPSVWWPGREEEGVSKGAMDAALAKYSATLVKVRVGQGFKGEVEKDVSKGAIDAALANYSATLVKVGAG